MFQSKLDIVLLKISFQEALSFYEGKLYDWLIILTSPSELPNKFIFQKDVIRICQNWDLLFKNSPCLFFLVLFGVSKKNFPFQ